MSESIYRLHGANPEKLYAASGIAMPENVMDFSTNASVVPWTPPEIDLCRLASRYPDDDCAELRGVIAKKEGVPVKNVLFTNGSNEALYLVASYMGQDAKRAAVLHPAYSECEIALNAYGVNTTGIFDISEARGFDAVFLSNPCNPTGDYISGLPELARENPKTLFIIDEAYIDFLLTGKRDIWDVLPNVILLRSMTKFYCLSGLRAGYVIAHEAWIERLKARRPTWSVNAAAQSLSLSFLRDNAFAKRSLEFYRRETPCFISAVEDAGFAVRPTRVHFFLTEVRDDEGVIKALLRRGIVVRHTRNFKGLDEASGRKYIRAATRSRDDNMRFATALRELRKEGVC